MQPKVPPETDEVVHEHVGGSTGGPGENSADCACGLSFAGFDTHAEVMAALNEHIAAAMADSRGSKPASKLAPGDWIASVEADDKGPRKVIAVHPYDGDGEPMFAIVYERPGVEPAVVSACPDADIYLATDAERSAVTEEGRRAKFVADLRSFAAWFEDRPWLPLPEYALSAGVQINLHGQDGIDRVLKAGMDLNVKPRVLEDRTSVGVDLGSVDYRIIAWHDQSDPTGLDHSREVDNGDASTPVPAGVDGAAMTGRGE